MYFLILLALACTSGWGQVKQPALISAAWLLETSPQKQLQLQNTYTQLPQPGPIH